LVEGAPRLQDYLGEASRAHLASVCSVLDAVGQPYTINHRLVRGMDYYNLTVFEWVTDRLGAQGTVCGGGRYDGLFAQIGGKAAPAVGWGMGMERVLALLEDAGLGPGPQTPDVYAVVPDAAQLPLVMPCLEQLRRLGLKVQMHAGGVEGQGRFKAQFKRADASGAHHALIFGSDELARGEVGLKDLRDADAAQVVLPLAAVAEWGISLLPSGGNA
jgi:histidyl-tRNA synthetase